MQAAKIFATTFRRTLQNTVRSCSHLVTKKSKLSPSSAKYFMAAVPVATFGLGCWQIQRLARKNELIRKLDEMKSSEAVNLPDDLRELIDKEYMRYKVRGTFDHENELYLGPRLEMDSKDIGNLVITPFKVEGKNHTILVQRGWVSRNSTNPVTRPEGQVKGTVEIVGILRKSEPNPLFISDKARDGIIFWRRDINEMAQLSQCAPIFLEATKETTIPGGPIGGQTRIKVINDHLSYIITWFSLSLMTTLMWLKKYKKVRFLM